MLFFSEADNKNVNSINSLKSTTLQVRIPCVVKPDNSIHPVSFRRKRASSFASPRAQGSLTVEAALCLSFMVFAMVILMLPMKIMNTRRQLQARLEAVNEELCRYTYLTYRQEQGDQELGIMAEDMMIGLGYEWYAQAKLLEASDTKRIRNVSMGRSSILEDGETIDLIFDYELELPFAVFSLDAVSQSVRSWRRAWIGVSGVAAGGEREEEMADRMVYLGKGGTRYHYSRECHYLSNQLQPVSREQAEALRNDSGGKYHPCAVCGAGNQSVVYILPNGSRYHTQRQCRAIMAYVRAVKLSEAVHLGGCSYCVK